MPRRKGRWSQETWGNLSSVPESLIPHLSKATDGTCLRASAGGSYGIDRSGGQNGIPRGLEGPDACTWGGAAGALPGAGVACFISLGASPAVAVSWPRSPEVKGPHFAAGGNSRNHPSPCTPRLWVPPSSG